MAVETVEAAPRAALGRRRRAEALRDYAVPLALVVVFAALSVTAENFLTSGNLLNVLDQATTIGIIATAGTLVIIAGGFDLSVGAIFAMSGVIAAELANRTSPGVGLAAGIACGALFGLANAATIGSLRINPFIATLASSMIIRGLALAITGGALVLVEAESFSSIGSDEVLGIRLGVWIFVLWAAAMAFLLSGTTFGRYLRSCGGNEEAARLSGVRVGFVRGATFVISGLAASLAGVLAASRVSTGQADVGVGLELTAVAAIVVGGTSIWGGEGAVWRTVVGVLLLATISNGFNLLGIDSVYQQVVYGAIILVAVGVDAQLRKGA